MATQANVQDWEAVTNAKFKGDSNERADALEHKLMRDMERIPLRSVLFTSGDRDPTGPIQDPLPPGKHVVQGPDPRLKPMPDKPTLMDFFRLRFGSATNHLLQSANLARKGGYNEKVVLACLLHDIGVVGFIRSDHGYWGAQLIEPYVDEEVSWAIRDHQALRFFPDEGFRLRISRDVCPALRRRFRSRALHQAGLRIRAAAQMVQDRAADLRQRPLRLRAGRRSAARGVRGHHRPQFPQPEEGLGWDNTPASHMWRTIMMPTRAL